MEVTKIYFIFTASVVGPMGPRAKGPRDHVALPFHTEPFLGVVESREIAAVIGFVVAVIGILPAVIGI